MIDPITLEVICESMIAIVREMRATIIRASYSSVIYEFDDFSCAMFGADGQMVAQSWDHPGHVLPLPWGLPLGRLFATPALWLLGARDETCWADYTVTECGGLVRSRGAAASGARVPRSIHVTGWQPRRLGRGGSDALRGGGRAVASYSRHWQRNRLWRRTPLRCGGRMHALGIGLGARQQGARFCAAQPRKPRTCHI